MYRSKDFMLMDVMGISGRKMGFIRDVLVNFHSGYVIGFCISPYKIFQKTHSILKEDIITFNSHMVVKETRDNKGLKLSEFKGMDVFDISGNIVGMIEDIIFDDNTFKINGVVISTGLIRNLIDGKKIFLISELILGEKNVLYFNENTKMSFVTIPHELMEVDYDE
ncbi:MAG: PRC-barrel domain-containing protein [Clostridium sp.]|nr:PRC-barrel domain-containing protein [Clostridium sp.]